jgi:hypothetical protein
MRNPIFAVSEKWRTWSKVQRGLVVVGAAGLCLMVAGTANRSLKPPTKTTAALPPTEYQAQYPVASGGEPATRIDENEAKELPAQAASDRDVVRKELGNDTRSALGNPLIAHTAELAVATKEFGRSRTALEEILERHRGYAAKLRMLGQRGGSSLLNATLRVPSTELGGTVSELKSLGDVEREEQAADEITQQRADLEARRTNAQNMLRRLQELLKKQMYPDGNVRELERQIGNASAEVARLEAERQASEHRVVFASVYFTLREEIAKPSDSLGAQLRSAATAGFGDAMASMVGLLAFLIARGPVVVLWCAILYAPARLIWKKWAPVAAQPAAMASGN